MSFSRASATDFMIRFFDRNGVAERWFATRDDRTAFVITELAGKYIGWEDPARDCNNTNPYLPGEDLR